MTDVISHAIALLIGLLIGALINWEEIRQRLDRDEDGLIHLATAGGVVTGIATLTTLVLVTTPLDLRELGHWQGIRWGVIAACVTTSVTLMWNLSRQWAVMPRRSRAVSPTLVLVFAGIAYFEWEAFHLDTPVTGIRNVVFLLTVSLVNLVLLIDFEGPAAKVANPDPG